MHNTKNINRDIWCVIPVYNNALTIKQVVQKCLKYINKILIIDDGSTDENLSQLLNDYSVEVLRHKKNRGKGAALKSAVEYLRGKNADYMITIDGDDQHYPEDIPKFIEAISKNNHAVIVGCRNFNTKNVPGSSSFGRKFSNMWVRLETGLRISDTQSGFRAYPVKYISQIKTLANSYNFEIEILSKSIWKGLDIIEVPVKTYYPKPEERVSHFKPFSDNFRLSLTHTKLVTLRLLPIPQKKFFKKSEDELDFSIIFHPVRVLKLLLKEHTSAEDLSLAAFVGTLLAILPIPGFHSVAIIYAATRLKLNRILAFNIQHFFMPPVTPVLCIELGHFLIYGKLLLNISFQTIIVQMPYRILEWILGALILAPVFAFIMAILTYFIAKIVIHGKNNRKNKQ